MQIHIRAPHIGAISIALLVVTMGLLIKMNIDGHPASDDKQWFICLWLINMTLCIFCGMLSQNHQQVEVTFSTFKKNQYPKTKEKIRIFLTAIIGTGVCFFDTKETLVKIVSAACLFISILIALLALNMGVIKITLTQDA